MSSAAEKRAYAQYAYDHRMARTDAERAAASERFRRASAEAARDAVLAEIEPEAPRPAQPSTDSVPPADRQPVEIGTGRVISVRDGRSEALPPEPAPKSTSSAATASSSAPSAVAAPAPVAPSPEVSPPGVVRPGAAAVDAVLDSQQKYEDRVSNAWKQEPPRPWRAPVMDVRKGLRGKQKGKQS